MYEAVGESSYFNFDFDEVNPQAVAPGNYFAMVHDEHFCFQIIPYEVLENPELNLALTFESTQELITASVSGGTPPYAYSWSDDTVAPEISDAVPGMYHCEVTDALGCVVDAEIEVAVGVEETAEQELNAYPLPFRDQLIFESDRPVDWRIYNLNGQLMNAGKDRSRVEINTADWSSGCYVLITDQKILKVMKE
jgi:hypothetical protein